LIIHSNQGFRRIALSWGLSLVNIEMHADTNYEPLSGTNHHARKRERGFNQADLICAGISDIWVYRLTKIDQTPQIYAFADYVDTYATKSNIKNNSYSGRLPILKGGTYLLVDDVLKQALPLLQQPILCLGWVLCVLIQQH